MTDERVPPFCALCGDEERPLQRFNLMRPIKVNGVRTTRGCGTIVLCARCWKAATSMGRRR